MTPRRFPIPPASPVSRCRSCSAAIHWIETRSGKRMPVNPDGVSHFDTCANADEHRRARTMPAAESIPVPALDPPAEAGHFVVFPRTDGAYAIVDRRKMGIPPFDATVRVAHTEAEARRVVRELGEARP